MGKHRQGGQSAQRFERLIEKLPLISSNERRNCFDFILATEPRKHTGSNNWWTGATKDFVVKNDYFHHEIAKKISETTFDVGYSNESGVRELVDNAGT